MGKPLSPDLVLARAKTDNLYMVKKINLWGNDIDDVKLLRQMPNVEVLSLSVNKISSLKEFGTCSKLQELYLRKNNISDISEIRYLVNLQHLKILWLLDNPCSEVPQYREYVIKMLPNLVKLDNEAITPEERAAASKLNLHFGDYHVSPKNQNPSYSAQDQGFDNDDQGNKYAGEYQNQRNYDYNDDTTEQRDEGVRKTNVSEQPVRERPSTGARDYAKDYQSDKNKQYEKNLSNFKNENVICAIVTLLKELDEKGLEFVKEDINRKISNLRIRDKE